MFDAIVLAGGSARRLGGADKPGVEIGGQTLLDRAVAAAQGAEQIIVVGPERVTALAVRWRREQPPGGGPVAALAAALGDVSSPWCLVLAADLPWIAGAVPALLSAATAGDVAVLADSRRRNYLAAAWRTAALRAALASLPGVENAAARSLYSDVRVIEVIDEVGWGHDCDTPADVERAQHTFDNDQKAQP